MLTISGIVKEIIKNSPFIEEALNKKIINLSALSREIKPEIEKKLLKEVKEGAIVMALKRLEKNIQKETKKRKERFNILNLTVKSNLSIFTFANSPTLTEKIKVFQKTISKKLDTTYICSEGIKETTFLISSEIKKEIKKGFNNEKLIFTKNHLSSITLRLSQKIIFIPGVYYQILKILAWENVNIIELFSTYTELSIIIEKTHLKRAFSVLNDGRSQSTIRRSKLTGRPLP